MTERTELFRPEVLQSRLDSNNGTPLYQQHSLLRGGVIVSIALVIFLILMLSLTPYKETEPARGILVSSEGSYKVVAPFAAVVQQIKVEPGETVTKGQVLATLRSSTYTEEGSPVELQQIKQLMEQRYLLQQQLKLQSEMAAKHHQQLTSAVGEFVFVQELLDEEARLLQQQLNLKTANLESMEALQRREAISKSQLEFAKIEQLDFQLRVQTTKQRQLDIAAQKNSKQVQLDNLKLESATTQLQLTRELQNLQSTIEQIESKSHSAIVAAEDGVVSALAVISGESVHASQPLVYVAAAPQQLEAMLFVTSSAIGQMYPGQEMLLNYDAFNSQFYGRYRATVSHIDKASLDPREHLLPVPGIQEPVFSIKATLAQFYVEGPDIYRLQAGMLFSANIVTAEMSLMALIFKPIMQLRARLV